MKKVFVFVLSTLTPLLAEDWPRFLGKGSKATWKEEDIRTDLGNAKELWRIKTGWGYAGPSLADGKVYLPEFVRDEGELMNNPGKAVDWKGTERVRCLDLKTGKELWSHDRKLTYTLSYPGGPRTTPTIANGRVFYLGAMGHLVCLDAEKGTVIWESDFQKDFGAPLPIWGFSAHPLVVGDTLYCLVGGEGSIAVAFEAATGTVKWKSLSGENQGYCPPSLIEIAGQKQVVIWQPDALSGLNPATGNPFWSIPLKPRYNMSVTIPRVVGNQLFASGIGRVGALIQLDDKPSAKILWRGKPKTAVYTCNSTPVVVDGVLYGNDIDTSNLIAMEWKTGRTTLANHRTCLFQKGSPGRPTRHRLPHLSSGQQTILDRQ